MSRSSGQRYPAAVVRRFCAASWMALSALTALAPQTQGARVDFNRDIRPVMLDTCFRCHGPDANARKAGLRLDLRTEALKPGKSGSIPIVPGQPEKSEVIRRLFAAKEDERMPPKKFEHPLSTEQREVFRRWIAEGAEYRDHWAFIKPVRPELPKVADAGWPRTAIDRFILSQLEQKRLKPSREADRRTLIRRVSLDLTGLPPTPAEVDVFVANPSPRAYEKLVDRLLASPRYGERMAQDWLDAARFADSNGYQVDRDREMYAWRDWVVQSFNHNLPFDRFTIEQLAGDLLPNPTRDQKIATGFNRNHMINEEGGIIPEEFLAEYCANRVETTATVWLGLTMNCTRCHDHKYDPFTQKDFYSLLAFFHNVSESGVGTYSEPIRRNTPPFVKLPTSEAETKLAKLKGEVEQSNLAETNLSAKVLAGQANWEQRAKSTVAQWQDAEVLRTDLATNATELKGSDGWVQVPALKAGRERLTMSCRIVLPRVTAVALALAPAPGADAERALKLPIAELHLARAKAGEAEPHSLILRAGALSGIEPPAGLAKALDEKASTIWRPTLSKDQITTAILEVPEVAQGSNEVALKLEVELAPEEALPAWQLRLQATDLASDLLVSPQVLAIVGKPMDERSADEKKQVEDFRLAHHPEYFALTQRIAHLKKQIEETDLSIPITLVMEELPEPRPTFILVRGAYDKPGEPVFASTPAHLNPFPSGQPTNRLGLARWLVDPANPLTARVTVNRLWQSVFGAGLVRTAEDFGTRGELPTHPELVDWLAIEFIRSGWDVKHMMKLLVTSATYRQDSHATPELRALDPDNRLLARGPRYRLSAEAIRDQALAVSGLLVEQQGGPSVRPYHPPGLYEQVVSGSSASTYVQGHGADLYRRTLYTYWKRSVPNPAMLIFDVPFRETCTVRRARTTTPLQALNLMNDPTYVEAARFLAQRMMREGGAAPESRIWLGFRLVTCRQPRPAELSLLTASLRHMEAGFRADPAGAQDLLSVGETKPDPSLDPVELAAYSTVASTLLNLDETITKQ